MEKDLRFPSRFLWGSATSSYQVEGQIENCDWSRFYDAGLACDHYHLYEKDFGLIRELEQNAYRFSIEWSRIEPREGEFDQKEIKHYFKMLCALKSRGIKVMLTLHHFTLPLWFAEMGGFTNKKSVFYFSRFAQRVFQEYEGLVDFWQTINEPLVYASQGYLGAVWPPQKKNPILFLRVIRNQIKAHKRIYEMFHKNRKKEDSVLVGIAKNNIYFEPHNPKSPLDKTSCALSSYFWNHYFLNKIKNHLDFIGLNYYFHQRVKFPFLNRNENKMISDIGWEIYPQGIYHLLLDLKTYHLPLYITENGLADKDDKKRKDFIKSHLIEVHRAIDKGADVRGYFHWSLMDNFEWEKGFAARFGLIQIDYKTMERKPRKSAYYFAKICRDNSLTLS